MKGKNLFVLIHLLAGNLAPNNLAKNTVLFTQNQQSWKILKALERTQACLVWPLPVTLFLDT